MAEIISTEAALFANAVALAALLWSVLRSRKRDARDGEGRLVGIEFRLSALEEANTHRAGKLDRILEKLDSIQDRLTRLEAETHRKGGA